MFVAQSLKYSGTGRHRFWSLSSLSFWRIPHGQMGSTVLKIELTLSMKGTFFSKLVQSYVAACPHSCGLEGAVLCNYVEPRLRTKFGERAFSFAGPHTWNQLSTSLRATPHLNSFKKQLKTHLFNIAFSH